MYAFVAILILSIGYWWQIYKNHKTRHVEDLSITYFLCMAVGVSILAVHAVKEGSWVFFLKQISILIPSIIIIQQIFKYKQKEKCNCVSFQQLTFKFCPNCGKKY